MRVLHLIDPASPGGGACTLRLLADVNERLTSVRHDTIVLGTGRHARLAKRCGIQNAQQVPMPRYDPPAARRSLRRLIQIHEANSGQFTLLHAWTPRALRLAMLAAPERKRLATFNVGPISTLETQQLVRLMRHHEAPILTSSAAVQHEYRTLGLGGEMLSMLPPAINPEAVTFISRARLRKRWEVDEKTFLIGLFSEPTNWADALIAMEIVARLSLTGRRFKLLVHHSAHRRAAAERRYRDLFEQNLILVDDEVAEPWRVVRGVDAALLMGGELNAMDLRDMTRPFAFLTGGGRRLRPMPGVLPLLWAMAAGVPVVAEAGEAGREIINDDGHGLLINPGDVNAACDRFMRLNDEPTLAHRVGASGREYVESEYHISAYCVRLKRAYEQHAAGRPVRVMPEVDEPYIDDYEPRKGQWVQRWVGATEVE